MKTNKLMAVLCIAIGVSAFAGEPAAKGEAVYGDGWTAKNWKEKIAENRKLGKPLCGGIGNSDANEASLKALCRSATDDEYHAAHKKACKGLKVMSPEWKACGRELSAKLIG